MNANSDVSVDSTNNLFQWMKPPVDNLGQLEKFHKKLNSMEQNVYDEASKFDNCNENTMQQDETTVNINYKILQIKYDQLLKEYVTIKDALSKANINSLIQQKKMDKQKYQWHLQLSEKIKEIEQLKQNFAYFIQEHNDQVQNLKRSLDNLRKQFSRNSAISIQSFQIEMPKMFTYQKKQSLPSSLFMKKISEKIQIQNVKMIESRRIFGADHQSVNEAQEFDEGSFRNKQLTDKQQSVHFQSQVSQSILNSSKKLKNKNVYLTHPEKEVNPPNSVKFFTKMANNHHQKSMSRSKGTQYIQTCKLIDLESKEQSIKILQAQLQSEYASFSLTPILIGFICLFLMVLISFEG